MSKSAGKQSFFRNTVFASLTSLSDIFFLLLLIISGRYLGAQDFGAFNAGLAIASLLIFSTNLGLDSLVIREISLNRNIAATITGDLLILKAIIIILAITIHFTSVHYATENTKIHSIVFILSLAAIFRSVNISLRSILQAHERFDLETLIVFIERISIFVAGMFVLVMDLGIVALAYAFLIMRFCNFIIFLLVAYKTCGKIHFRLPGKHSLKLQKEALPYGIALITYGLFMQTDILMLAYFKTDLETGIFSAAYKLFEGFFIIPLVISSVVYPRLSNHYVSDKDKFQYYSEQVIKFIIWAGFLVFSSTLLFSDFAINMLYGQEFHSASQVLMILGLSALFAYGNNITFTLLRATGQQRRIMHTIFIGLVVKTLIDIVLIPVYAEIGAATGSAASSFAMFIICILALKDMSIIQKRIISAVIKIALIFGVIIAMCKLLPIQIPILQMLIFLATTISLTLLFKIFTFAEIRSLLVNKNST